MPDGGGVASLPVPGCLLNGVGVGASMVRRPTDVASYLDPVPGQTRNCPCVSLPRKGEEGVVHPGLIA